MTYCRICKEPLTSHDLFNLNECLESFKTEISNQQNQLTTEIKRPLINAREKANKTLASNEVKD